MLCYLFSSSECSRLGHWEFFQFGSVFFQDASLKKNFLTLHSLLEYYRLQSMGLLRVRHTERLPFHFSLSYIEEENGNPLQCSCLENPRDGGAWWVAVYGVAQSWKRLKRLSSGSSFDLLIWFTYLFVYFLNNFYWSIVALQCYVSFCCYSKWHQPYVYTYPLFLICFYLSSMLSSSLPLSLLPFSFTFSLSLPPSSLFLFFLYKTFSTFLPSAKKAEILLYRQRSIWSKLWFFQ